VLVSWPVLPAEQRQRDFDERDFNLAVGLVERERLDEAHALARELDARHPGSARIATLQADLDWRRARLLADAADATPEAREEARLLMQSALERLEAARPRARAQERFGIHLLAGAIQQYLGQWERAARHYREARAFDPEDPDVRRRLAVAAANAAMLHPPGPEREQGLRAAEALLVGLVEDEAGADVQALLTRIRAEL
jgi:tetratricopeptide (TPR) repeat protein